MKYECPNCASLMEQNTELDKKLSEWVGLTEEELLEAAKIAEKGNYLVAFQRIQAKLKEKNI